LKSRYAGNFRAALESALASLSAKEATLLKLCYLENIGPQALARMYSVSPRTAQRWLVAARDTLLERTRTALAASLSVRPAELDSLMMLVGSQLHVTLERVFAKRQTDSSVHEPEQ
jgi:RNA polymerase sigma-70 factor (ECF subfamily)